MGLCCSYLDLGQEFKLFCFVYHSNSYPTIVFYKDYGLCHSNILFADMQLTSKWSLQVPKNCEFKNRSQFIINEKTEGAIKILSFDPGQGHNRARIMRKYSYLIKDIVL